MKILLIHCHCPEQQRGLSNSVVNPAHTGDFPPRLILQMHPTPSPSPGEQRPGEPRLQHSALLPQHEQELPAHYRRAGRQALQRAAGWVRREGQSLGRAGDVFRYWWEGVARPEDDEFRLMLWICGSGPGSYRSTNSKVTLCPIESLWRKVSLTG